MIIIVRTIFLRVKAHCENGSPEYPAGHAQIGLWFLTVHNAWIPQVFGQGSKHFWFVQALSKGHSELTTHSGLHWGGLPM